jgi:hypothetical protein
MIASAQHNDFSIYSNEYERMTTRTGGAFLYLTWDFCWMNDSFQHSRQKMIYDKDIILIP